MINKAPFQDCTSHVQSLNPQYGLFGDPKTAVGVKTQQAALTQFRRAHVTLVLQEAHTWMQLG